MCIGYTHRITNKHSEFIHFITDVSCIIFSSWLMGDVKKEVYALQPHISGHYWFKGPYLFRASAKHCCNPSGNNWFLLLFHLDECQSGGHSPYEWCTDRWFKKFWSIAKCLMSPNSFLNITFVTAALNVFIFR